MKTGDLVWCLYHIYFLPKQGIIVNTLEESMVPNDIFYEVLIEGETHTLSRGELFNTQTDALEFQIEVLRVSKGKPKRKTIPE